MPTYRYSAVDKTGRPARGRIDAANDIDLELRLRRMGLDLITCRKLEATEPLFAHGSITRQDLITFCFHLEQISRAGIPLLEGLADLRSTIENQRFREVIAAMLEDMEGGKMLSQAAASHPRVFDRLFISLIRAGEQTGNMAEVLENLGGALKWQDELVGQTRRLLVYPALVLVVVTGVIFFLMLYLVPQLVSFLKNMGQELPLQTRVLLYVSELFSSYWPLFIALPVIGIITGVILMRHSARTRYLLDYAKLRLPVVGPIMQKIIMARFANFFALLYRSGITILDAVATCEGIVANRVIADGLRRAGQQISGGDSLAESFENLGLFPPLVVRMVKIGETTGALDRSLLNVSYFYNRDVQESVDKALKLLEPALTVFLGLILALIMFSVLSPIYDILGKLKI